NNQEERLTLADDRRLIDLRAVQIPAHAELEVVRGDVLQHDGGRSGRAIEESVRAGASGAEIDIAVGEFKRNRGSDPVGQTRVRRPSQIPGTVVRKSRHRAIGGTVKDLNVLVTEAAQIVVGRTDTGADKWGDTPPGTQINVAVGQKQELRLAAEVVVRLENGR